MFPTLSQFKPADSSGEASNERGVRMWKMVSTHLSEAWSSLSRAVVRTWLATLRFLRWTLRLLLCLIAGLGTGLIAAGIFALNAPEQWDMQKVRELGPPLGPVLFSAGLALLTAELFMLIAAARLRRRAK